jgi:uncharacterized membrane protein YccC
MIVSRPSYAPSSPRRCLPQTQRLRLRLRHRARRGWSVKRLLNERRQLLAALEALDQTQASVATRLRQHATQKPVAREALEQANDKAQTTIERDAERMRHRLTLDDGILDSRGLRPWEQATNSP